MYFKKESKKKAAAFLQLLKFLSDQIADPYFCKSVFKIDPSTYIFDRFYCCRIGRWGRNKGFSIIFIHGKISSLRGPFCSVVRYFKVYTPVISGIICSLCGIWDTSYIS